MKNKILNISFLFLPLVLGVIGCNNSNNSLNSYDGKTYDISLLNDNLLTLKSIKSGENFKIEINGIGQGKDYTSSQLPDWNPIKNYLNEVQINEGITHIGDYYFNNSKLENVILPSTVNSIAEHAFDLETKLFSYSTNEISTKNEIYYYSGNAPTTTGNYFHIVEGEIVIWEEVKKEMSILFIGNSYTYYGGEQTVENPGVPTYFKKIAKNLGHEFKLDWVVRGSHKLSMFASSIDEYGKILEEKLKTNTYSHIILQEHSTTPVKDYTGFASAVKTLKNKINKYQEDSEIILYQTWGCEGRLETTGCKDIPELEQKLRDAYTNVGKAYGLKVHYVGKAFTEVYLNHKEINLYNKDKVHQSDLGAYLSALVHVKGVFNDNVTTITEYCGLDKASCKTLQNVANNN